MMICLVIRMIQHSCDDDARWPRLTGCLIFIGHFPSESLTVNGSFVERDLQLGVRQARSRRAPYGSDRWPHRLWSVFPHFLNIFRDRTSPRFENGLHEVRTSISISDLRLDVRSRYKGQKRDSWDPGQWSDPCRAQQLQNRLPRAQASYGSSPPCAAQSRWWCTIVTIMIRQSHNDDTT